MYPLFYFVLWALSDVLTFNVEHINVKTQEQFDAAVNMVNNGKAVYIKLSEKTFVLKQKLVANAPLSIDGKGATIIYYDNIYDLNNVFHQTKDFNIYLQRLSNLRAIVVTFARTRPNGRATALAR